MNLKRLFVWSGGGFPGIDLHTGMWLALSEKGIHATHNAGCSAGAIMGALNSAGYRALDIAVMVRKLKDQDLRKERFAWKLRIPFIEWFLDSAPIAEFLNTLLPTKFADLKKPLDVVVVELPSGAKYVFRNDYSVLGLREAVLASMSISGVFPWVRSGGEYYCDGGPRANVPLPQNWRDYDEIYLLIASRPLHYKGGSTKMVTRLLLNLDLYAHDQIADVLDETRAYQHRKARPRVIPIWPFAGDKQGSFRFDHGLIDSAYCQAMDVLRGV